MKDFLFSQSRQASKDGQWRKRELCLTAQVRLISAAIPSYERTN